MSAIREDQLKNASAFFKDYWPNLVKAYYNPEDSDAWWNEMINKTHEIGHKYCENDQRLMKICVAFEKGCAEVWKNEQRRR